MHSLSLPHNEKRPAALIKLYKTIQKSWVGKKKGQHVGNPGRCTSAR